MLAGYGTGETFLEIPVACAQFRIIQQKCAQKGSSGDNCSVVRQLTGPLASGSHEQPCVYRSIQSE